jgi:hypothetical protein
VPDLPGVIAQIAPGEPFLEAALAPLAQVLGADGDAGEVVLDDFLGFRQGVEPGEELGAFLGLFEALIQLVADVAGEAGYFAVAGAHNFKGVCCGFNISIFHHGFNEPFIELHYSIDIHQNNNYFKLFL